MQRSRLFLVLASLLALAWTAWLGYQAYTSADPIVVSRPQLLVAPVIVEVVLDAAGGNPRQARVVKIYRGGMELGVPEADTEPKDLHIRIHDLEGRSAGAFLLALRPTGAKGEFEVVPIPKAPGFRGVADPTPTYPATAATREQVREVLRRYRGE